MPYGFRKSPLKPRRAVSQIIGSLVVLGLVASIGSVILFQGLGHINNFQYELELFDVVKNDALRERLAIQHVSFTPNSDSVTLHVGNYGNVEATIQSVTMVKLDSQELILAWQAPLDNSTIQIDGISQITMEHVGDLDCPPPGTCSTPPIWDDDEYVNSNYEIRITTTRGTFLEPYAVTPWDG